MKISLPVWKMMNLFIAVVILPSQCLAIIPFGFWNSCGNLNAQWAPQWSSLQSYLRLDETTTGTAPGGKDFRDYSGNGNHATQSSGVLLNQSGKLGKGVSFTGNSARKISVPAPGIDTTAGHSVTVTFWMNWNGTNDNGSGWTVVFGFNTLSLTFNSSNYFGFCTSNLDVYGISAAGVPTNTWVHVAAVITNGDLTSDKLYLNGVAQTMSQKTGTPINTGDNSSATTPVAIGNLQGNSIYDFQGQIDEFAIFNGALSAAQIATLYNFQKNSTRSCP